MERDSASTVLPMGAHVRPGGVHFRVWAPKARQVSVVCQTGQSDTRETRLNSEQAAPEVFSGLVQDANSSTLYRYRLVSAEDSGLYPDPMSRFQPEGPHGPSQVVDPHRYQWHDHDWPGSRAEDQVIYEMHIGTFTEEGTWSAAIEHLEGLADLGVTLLEVMPVADFPGQFGWGYDGVNLFAPSRLYGRPDEMRAFVDYAHQLKLGVVLDVVYNHLGPDGNYLGAFSDQYFTERYKNDWGQALNFDGEGSERVREFFISNAAYWISEFHLDGLRLDATHAIFDSSSPHILAEIGAAVRQAANGRATVIVSENEPQQTRLVRSLEQGGYGLDLLWNDDYHHSAMAVISGHSEAYYTDYLGTAQEFVSAAKWGFLYQGQRYKWQKQNRGTSTIGLSPSTFVNFIENHDQIANSARGLRGNALASPGQYRALTALTILMPGTPMLFQGQEFAASTPFLFFADHPPELRTAVQKGRREFLSQFPSINDTAIQAIIPDPGDPETFQRSKLIARERQHHVEASALHRDLIKLRRSDPVLRSPRRAHYDGAVLGPQAFLIRYFGEEHPDRLLIVNLGRDLSLDVIPEPLIAAPSEMNWQLHWSSEDVRYGGQGVVVPVSEVGWKLPGQATMLLIAVPED